MMSGEQNTVSKNNKFGTGGTFKGDKKSIDYI